MVKMIARVPAAVVALAAILIRIPTAAAGDDGGPVWEGVERVVAVGDVHGDHAQFVKALRAAKIIGDSGDWIAGKTHLVQLGDVLDRGTDSRMVLDLLMKLEAQAAKAGGRVHALIGNHEAMVLMGYLGYLHPREPDAYGGLEAFRKAMGPDGIYGRWIRRHDTVIKINDVLFVHGGLSSEYAGRSLKEINDAVRSELEGKAKPEVTEDPDGPLWYRGLAGADGEALEKRIGPVLKAHGAARIVIGHTVTGGEITVRAGGRVIMIDVGMSGVYGGPAACLLIEKGKYFGVCPDGTRELPVGGAGKPTNFRGRAPSPPEGAAQCSLDGDGDRGLADGPALRRGAFLGAYDVFPLLQEDVRGALPQPVARELGLERRRVVLGAYSQIDHVALGHRHPERYFHVVGEREVLFRVAGVVERHGRLQDGERPGLASRRGGHKARQRAGRA